MNHSRLSAYFNQPAYFLLFLLFLFLVLIGYHTYKYYIVKNFILEVFTACNPTIDICFIADSNIADPNFQSEPYKKVIINADYAPQCLEEHSCENFSCDGISGNCSVIYCSQESVADGEMCSIRLVTNP